MAQLRLSKNDKEKLVNADHNSPRSVLGFHEVEKADKRKVWVIRVMDNEALEVWLYFMDQEKADALPMKRIHPRGLFELVMEPRAKLVPYYLRSLYEDEVEHIKVDPFYFSVNLNEYDCHLWNEGNHHRIYRKLGAHYVQHSNVKGTVFAVWAPNARRVSVVGEFNQWDGRKHLMQSIGMSGMWELFIPGVEPGQQYKYEVKTQWDEIRLKSDPFGFQMQMRPSNVSVVADVDGFAWSDQAWLQRRRNTNIYQEPVNIYEVHLATWRIGADDSTGFLTYREATETLIPYVKEMGYTHIELLPIHEHPFDGSWGYQVTGYFAPTSRHGSPKDLMYFINCCHQEGVGVILDWVPGHFPKDENGLVEFDGTCLYEHADPRQGEHRQWGTKVFNYGRKEVSNFLLSNALYWFDLYHVDGLRVDAVASMLYLDYNRREGEWVPNKYGGRENLEAVEFLRKTNSTIFHYYPDVMMIAEDSTSWPGVSHPTYTGGLGFNFKWNMGWMNDTLRYISLDPIYRKFDHHLVTFSIVYAFNENFVLPISHDEVVHGKGSLISKMPGDNWQKFANFRMYLMFMFAHPGKKLLFMGSEFAQWQEWRDFQSLDWHLLEYPDHQKTRLFVKELNEFYRSHPVMYTNDFNASGFEWIDLHDYESSVLTFIRRGKPGTTENPMIFVFNMTPIPRSGYNVGIPEMGLYRKLLDTDEARYGGSGYNSQYEIPSEGISWQGRPCKLMVDVPPLGCVVLTKV